MSLPWIIWFITQHQGFHGLAYKSILLEVITSIVDNAVRIAAPMTERVDRSSPNS